MTLARCGRALLWLVVSLAAGSAFAVEPAVFDTGYEVIPRTLAPSLYWVGNARLLFEGIDKSDMDAALADGKPHPVQRLKRLYLWDGRSRAVRFYADGAGLCVANGVVRFTLRIDRASAVRIVREGPPGSEAVVRIDMPGKDGRADTVYSPLACKSYARGDLSPPAPPGRRVVVLREGDGYLRAGPVGMAERVEAFRAHGRENIKLFGPRNPTGIDLPITLEQGPGYPIYSEYLGAYVTLPRPRGSAPGRITPWPRGLPFTVYSFNASGDAREITIPYGEWGAIAWAQPTSAGWIFAGHGAPTPKAGLFIYSSGAVRRLDSGYVYEIAVSPDGCRAGVAIKNRLLEINAPTNLRIVDLCGSAR
jgi:hypothetical protein